MNFYWFWHQVIFINSNKFSLLQFLAIIHKFSQCITVILMLTQHCITKKQLVKNMTLRFWCFQLMILVLYSRYHANIWCSNSFGITNRTTILDVASHMYTCNLLMYNFFVVLAWMYFHGFDDAFCMIHKNHVHNILHHQKISWESMFLMLYIWWYHVFILWNHQSHSNCFRSCNSLLIFWNVFSIFVWFLTVCFFKFFLFLNLFYDFCLLLLCSSLYHGDFGVQWKILIS